MIWNKNITKGTVSRNLASECSPLLRRSGGWSWNGYRSERAEEEGVTVTSRRSSLASSCESVTAVTHCTMYPAAAGSSSSSIWYNSLRSRENTAFSLNEKTCTRESLTRFGAWNKTLTWVSLSGTRTRTLKRAHFLDTLSICTHLGKPVGKPMQLWLVSAKYVFPQPFSALRVPFFFDLELGLHSCYEYLLMNIHLND